MKKAFTLAEILVTLTIIGVIAALTIPNLIQSINKDQYVNQLKRTYSSLTQAFNMINMENGGDVSTLFSTVGAGGDIIMLNAFTDKLNTAKYCGYAIGCWYNTPIYLPSGSKPDGDNIDLAWSGIYAKAVLIDGSMLRFDDYPGACDSTGGVGIGPLAGATCGAIEVDVNGAKGPNTVGRDVFFFWVTKNGVFPQGSYSDGYGCGSPFNTWGSTQGCAARVLSKNAMTY